MKHVLTFICLSALISCAGQSGAKQTEQSAEKQAVQSVLIDTSQVKLPHKAGCSFAKLVAFPLLDSSFHTREIYGKIFDSSLPRSKGAWKTNKLDSEVVLCFLVKDTSEMGEWIIRRGMDNPSIDTIYSHFTFYGIRCLKPEQGFFPLIYMEKRNDWNNVYLAVFDQEARMVAKLSIRHAVNDDFILESLVSPDWSVKRVKYVSLDNPDRTRLETEYYSFNFDKKEFQLDKKEERMTNIFYRNFFRKVYPEDPIPYIE